MAEDEAFAGDHLGAAAAITGAAAATTFSQLLFAADHDHDDDVDKNHYRIFNYSSSSSSSSAFAIGKPPKMLCFGNKEEPLVFAEPSSIFKSRQRSGLTCSDSSSTSSGNNGGRTKSDSKLKKPNGSDPEAAAAIKATAATNQRTSKKIRADAPGSAGHAKRKEKLGERITALQQLVSPFGKTDTASVLHEAMGYIKFLHEQVQVLCSPYLQNLPSSLSATGERENGEEEAAKSSEVDLRSRGLCLIPVDCSLHLANCTVADFWSPAMAMGRKL